jgi:integrase
VADTPRDYPEAGDLAALVREAQGHRFAPALSVLIGSGCRIGEVLALRWAGVDMDAGTVTVDGTVQRVRGLGVIVKPSPKNGTSFRKIPLPPFAVDALKRQRAIQAQDRLAAGRLWQDRGLVFPDEVGDPLAPNRFGDWFRVIAAKAGVKATPHSCRHAHASLLLAAGTPIADVADRLGHAGASVTMSVYAHVIADQRRAAANVIAAALDGIETKG